MIYTHVLSKPGVGVRSPLDAVPWARPTWQGEPEGRGIEDSRERQDSRDRAGKQERG